MDSGPRACRAKGEDEDEDEDKDEAQW